MNFYNQQRNSVWGRILVTGLLLLLILPTFYTHSHHNYLAGPSQIQAHSDTSAQHPLATEPGKCFYCQFGQSYYKRSAIPIIGVIELCQILPALPQTFGTDKQTRPGFSHRAPPVFG